MNRRQLLQIGGVAVVAVAAEASVRTAQMVEDEAEAGRPLGKPLRILILGGTGFLGPHLVAALQERGHELTLFNRGKRGNGPGLFKEIETLVGDRNGDVDALKGRDWDVVLDTSGFTSKQVKRTTEILRDHSKQYIFVSTDMAYADKAIGGIDENYPLVEIDEDVEDDPKNYAGAKVLAERVVEAAYGDGATIIRPALIVGPGDSQGFFTYWPVRVDQGGEVLAPGKPSDPKA